MSQAEDLLNSLVEDEVVVTSAEPETEPHIIINEDKTVTIPEALKRILVQYDHNIETVVFDCPRYWDGHDLSQMDMRIVFQRPDGHHEPHPVENLRVDESDDSMIHFDWTISRNTTLVHGDIRITVCAKITNAEGIADREWHTIPNQDLFVHEGMDCSGDELVEEYPDVIEFILAELDDLKNTGGISDERIADAVEAYMVEHPIIPDSSQNVNPVAKTEDMTQPVGVDENGQLWTAPTAGNGDGEEAEDILLGTLPMTISESNCYLLSETKATISTGEGAADLMDLSESEPTIGDKTYNGGAVDVPGKNTLKLSFENVGKNASATIPITFEVDKTYTIAARVVDKSSDLNTNSLPIIRANALAGAVSQIQLINSDAMQFKAFVAKADSILVTLPAKSEYVAGETYVTIEIHIYEGEFVEMPAGATFDILAGEKYNTDGYIGATLSEVDGKTVNVYKVDTSEAEAETDNGGVIFFGDSILHYSNVVDRYAAKTGKPVLKCAVGGTRMSASRDSANIHYPLDMANIADAIASGDFSTQLGSSAATAGFATLASANIPNYKAMVLEFGTNDFSAKVPFDGEDATSIKGAVQHILRQILTKYPNMRIVVLSTLQYVTVGTGNESGIPTHDDGTVWQMNEVIKGVCESDEFCVPFVDMYHAFGQNGITRNTLNSDGVHLTSPNGEKRYADILIGKLNALGI